MSDMNDCRFTGTATNIRAIQTKTGRAMAVFTLLCNRDMFKVVCFNGLATVALQMENGDRIELAGPLQVSEQYGPQIVVKDLNGATDRPEQERLFDDQQPGPDLSQYDFKGGPF